MARRPGLIRDLAILGILVTVVAAIVLGGALVQDRGSRNAGVSRAAPQVPPEPDATAPAGLTPEHGLLMGDADAPHRVVIYEDFLCPYCGLLEAASSDVLTAAANEGRASVEYRPIELLSQLGDYSKRSANAFAVVLDVAGPEVAKKFHDALYEDQPAEEQPFPDDAWLIEHAVEAGADREAITAPIESLQFGAWVDEATQTAFAARVSGTPTVLVDDEPVSGASIDELVANIESAIAE